MSDAQKHSGVGIDPKVNPDRESPAPTALFRSVGAERSSAASQLGRTMRVWRDTADTQAEQEPAEQADGKESQSSDDGEKATETTVERKVSPIQAKLEGLSRKVFRASNGGPLPANARSTNNADTAFAHLEKYCGVPRALASARLHRIKAAAGRGGADNVLFDFSGGVFDPASRECIGNLTQG